MHGEIVLPILFVADVRKCRLQMGARRIVSELVAREQDFADSTTSVFVARANVILISFQNSCPRASLTVRGTLFLAFAPNFRHCSSNCRASRIHLAR